MSVSRRRFLGQATAGMVAVSAGAVLRSATGDDSVANATPASGQALVGRLDQAINLRARQCAAGPVCATPRLLRNGRYALPSGVLDDPAYASVTDLLSGWSMAHIADDDYEAAADEVGDASDFILAVDGKLMRQAGRPSALTMPEPGVFRFEVRRDDFAGSYDADSGSRRSEVVARQQDGVGEATVWSSFCLVLGSTPGLAQAGRGIVHQWHSVDDGGSGRTPVLFVDVANSQLTIRTCSSAHLYGDDAVGSQNPQSGVQVPHFVTRVPEAGEHTYLTLRATFGAQGHLDVWLNGDQVVDADTPIGYYEDLADGSGRTVLGYPHWGLYTTNRPDTEVVYIANPEWGHQSLAERISDPLPVPAVP